MLQEVKLFLFARVQFIYVFLLPESNLREYYCEIIIQRRLGREFILWGPKNTKSEQSHKQLFAQSMNWLPGQGSNLRPAG